jgi:uncharacterized tellurite resistance protein B-like protein
VSSWRKDAGLRATRQKDEGFATTARPGTQPWSFDLGQHSAFSQSADAKPGPLGKLAPVDAEASRQVAELIENVIAADGIVTPEERDFLRRVMDRLGVSGSDREPVSIDPGRATATLRNLAPDLQTRVMALLVEGAIVDGIVQPEEHALLLASAATLGIEATALEERITRRLRSNVPAL